MSSGLGPIKVTRRQGSEQFRDGDQTLPFDLLSFWQWSASDLVENTMRGVLAEYLVARALGMGHAGARAGWDAYDLKTENGIKIEVKSSAYLQSWFQKSLSAVQFGVPKRRTWNPETNELSREATRSADVYVFAILAHKDKSTVDPLNLQQWEFYVLPTSVLDGRTRSQSSITLTSLRKLCPDSPVSFSGLRAAVEAASCGAV